MTGGEILHVTECRPFVGELEVTHLQGKVRKKGLFFSFLFFCLSFFLLLCSSSLSTCSFRPCLVDFSPFSALRFTNSSPCESGEIFCTTVLAQVISNCRRGKINPHDSHEKRKKKKLHNLHRYKASSLPTWSSLVRNTNCNCLQ